MAQGEDYGRLRIVLKKSIGFTPAGGAVIRVFRGNDNVSAVYSDSKGEAEITLPSPPFCYSQIPDPPSLPYAVYDLKASLGGHVPVLFKNVLIFPGVVTEVRHNFVRTSDLPKKRTEVVVIPPHKLSTGLPAVKGEDIFSNEKANDDKPVIIPEKITVRLGYPESKGENVTVPFIDYIKRVSSCELYPTWNENSLRAGIIAAVSSALNRIYSNHYKAKGYDFDITSIDEYDRLYIHNCPTFEPVDRLVYTLFDKYISRRNSVFPVLAFSHEGYASEGTGLSLWGSTELSKRYFTPCDILKYYFGDDVYIKAADVEEVVPDSYRCELFLASKGEEVACLQYRLNKIALNHKEIPFVKVTGLYDMSTVKAVEKFQFLFGLRGNGITDYAVWHRINYIYNSEKETNKDGINEKNIHNDSFPGHTLTMGCRDYCVLKIQHYLNEISKHFGSDIVPLLPLSGEFDERMRSSVCSFQNYCGFAITGAVDEKTWNEIINAYNGIPKEVSSISLPYPGKPVRYGDKGETVEFIQKALNKVGKGRTEIPLLEIDGIFGDNTRNALKAFQKHYALVPDGIAGLLTWERLNFEYAGLCENEGETRNDGKNKSRI